MAHPNEVFDEMNIHKHNLRTGKFTKADAIKIADMVANAQKSDPFIRDNAINGLMSGIITPQDLEQYKKLGEHNKVTLSEREV